MAGQEGRETEVSQRRGVGGGAEAGQRLHDARNIFRECCNKNTQQ